MNTRLVLTLVAMAAVLGCESDQDLGPDNKMEIEFVLNADEAHTHTFYTPIVRVTEWTVKDGGQKGLTGLDPGQEIELNYFLVSDPDEVASVRLTEITGTGAYLGDAVRLWEPGPYLFSVTVANERFVGAGEFAVTPERPHSSGLTYRVEFESSPGKIHAGAGPPATATPVSFRFLISDPATSTPVTGLAISNQVRIHVQDPTGKITAHRSDAAATTGDFLGNLITEVPPGSGIYEAVYTFPATLEGNPTWDIGIQVDVAADGFGSPDDEFFSQEAQTFQPD